MKYSKSILGCFIALLLVLSICGCAGSRNPLDGAWEKVEPELESSEFPLVKVLSGGHFAFGKQTQGGTTSWSGGGYYNYDGEKYTETVTYHSIPSLVGMTIVFDCVIEDGKWFHEALFETQGEKFHITEVWKRLDDTKTNQ